MSAHKSCLDAALKFLATRLHSETELRRKLTRGKWTPAAVEATVTELKRMGYVDDARFAKAKALSAAEHKHHGPRRAFAELMKAGVNRDIAQRALDDVYGSADNLTAARELAQKQSTRLKKLDPLVARRRLVGMLQRRGFDYETIKPVIDEVLGD